MVRADEHLARLITGRMAAQGLSLRALARQAGVSHSSISRLLRGRARPTADLLRAVAAPLGLPADELLGAAALAPAGAGDVLSALRGLGVDPAPPELIGHVQAELARLREYAATAEARAAVRRDLDRRLAALGARGPVAERLRGLARLYLSDAPAPARTAAGSAVLYFLQAVDAIDDFMWPIGYLDDAVAVALAEAEVQRLLPG